MLAEGVDGKKDTEGEKDGAEEPKEACLSAQVPCAAGLEARGDGDNNNVVAAADNVDTNENGDDADDSGDDADDSGDGDNSNADDDYDDDDSYYLCSIRQDGQALLNTLGAFDLHDNTRR